MIKDICVILVKFVDWFYNMCMLGVLYFMKCRRIVMEILEIYVFIVNCFGMNNVWVELEDFSFIYMYLMCVLCIKKVIKIFCGYCKDMVKKI